jgi:hypothetical protein
MAAELSPSAQLVLERISRVVEAHPDTDTRTIRSRAGLPRKVAEPGLARLAAHGFIERNRVDGEWRYRSVTPYRAAAEQPLPEARTRI